MGTPPLQDFILPCLPNKLGSYPGGKPFCRVVVTWDQPCTRGRREPLFCPCCLLLLCCVKRIDASRPQSRISAFPSHTSLGFSLTKAQAVTDLGWDSCRRRAPKDGSCLKEREAAAESDISWGLLTPGLSVNLALSSQWGHVSRHAFT